MPKKFLIILVVLLLVFPPSLLGAPGLARSAGAIWDLDDSGTRYDSVTQGVGPAGQFTRANSEYLSIADNASLSIGNGVSFSITAWVYLDDLPAGQMKGFVSKWDNASPKEYMLSYNATGNNRFECRIHDGTSDFVATANTFGAPSTATWYFLACTYNNATGTVSISVNDGGVDSTGGAVNVPDSTRTFRIGSDQDTNYQNGRIAQAGFWKKVLSASERTELYNSGKGYAYRDLTGSLKTSLISYWNLNESAGVRFDSQGSNDLQDNNTVTQATGVRGDNTLGRAATPYAGQFTAATSEYLSIADNASLSTGDIDFTISAWVYFDTIPAGGLDVVSKYDGDTAAQREYNLFLNGVGDGSAANWGVRGGGVESNVTSGTMVAGQWYFWVAWHDSVANTINIQVNNGTVASTSHTTGSTDSTTPFTIGRRNGTAGALPMNGRIALVGFWKKVLSATERAHLYSGGKGLTYSELSRTLSSLTTSLNAYWNLYEASGTRADSAGSNNLTDNNTVTQNAGVPRGSAGTVPTAAGRGKSSIAGQFTAANSEFLRVPDNVALSMGDIDMSIVAWVYADTLPANDTEDDLVFKWNSTALEYGLRIKDTAGADRFEFLVRNTANTTNTSARANTFGQPSTGTWYFVVGRHDATNDRVEISVNNGAFDTAATTGGVLDGTAPLTIGANEAPGSPHDGRIAKVGIWKKVLAAQEVTDLYNSGRGNSYDGAAFYKDTGSTLKTSLQAWWELDELCCTRFDKVSPGAGPAAQFTAANSEYLSKTDNADLSTGNIDFTITAWAYLDSKPASQMYIASKSEASNDEWILFWNNSTDRFQAMTAGSARSVSANTLGAPSLNTWYFIIAWHDATAGCINISVNGGTADQTCAGSAPTDGTATFRLGATNATPTNFWNGRIGLAGFWKRVLTAAERTTLYNSGSGRNCKDLNDQLRRKLISYWNLNEGSGTRFDCVGANDLADNATVTQATGVAGGNSLGDNATVTHNQGLPWWTKARASGQFTSANSEYLSRADNADLSTGNIDFSFGGWVYFDSIAVEQGIWGKFLNNNTDDEYNCRLSAADVSLVCIFSTNAVGGSASLLSTIDLSANTWYFVVFWHDATANTLNLQTNNGTVESIAANGGNDGAAPVTIGQRGQGAQFLGGRIDEVGFWKKVLTAQERTDLYNSGKANRYNGNSFEKDTNGTLTTSLTAYWTLDEASGTRYDSKGANHLTDNNTVTQNVGVDGIAAGQFTAANTEELSVPDNSALSTGDIDYSVAAWINLDSKPAGTSVAVVKGDFEYFLAYASGGDRLHFSHRNTNIVNANAVGSPSTGTWYLVIGWYEVATSSIFIQVNNGTVNSAATTVPGADTTKGFSIGGYNNQSNNAWDGRIDQVLFVKRVLTESERAQLWNEGTGQSYSNLQRPYKTGGF